MPILLVVSVSITNKIGAGAVSSALYDYALQLESVVKAFVAKIKHSFHFPPRDDVVLCGPCLLPL